MTAGKCHQERQIRRTGVKFWGKEHLHHRVFLSYFTPLCNLNSSRKGAGDHPVNSMDIVSDAVGITCAGVLSVGRKTSSSTRLDATTATPYRCHVPDNKSTASLTPLMLAVPACDVSLRLQPLFRESQELLTLCSGCDTRSGITCRSAHGSPPTHESM